jgi:hypothetical protein
MNYHIIHSHSMPIDEDESKEDNSIIIICW